MQMFGPLTTRAIFAGYHVESGGRWNSDYYMIAFDDYTIVDNNYRTHVTRERNRHGTPPDSPRLHKADEIVKLCSKRPRRTVGRISRRHD